MKAADRLADLQKQGFCKPLRTRRKPTTRQDASKRRAIEVATERFYRRAAGRITKKEARELGRLYGGDLHWRFMGSTGDKLAQREPGSFAKLWGDSLAVDLEWFFPFGITFKAERRAPRRWANETFNGRETACHMGYYLGWLGPRSGIWPGDYLAFDEAIDPTFGRERGWRVACAPDCPCGRCWRPTSGAVRVPS